jgi:flavodoxin
MEEMKKLLFIMIAILSGISGLRAQNDSTLIVYFSRAGYNYDVGVRDESVTGYYVGWISEGNTAVFARYIKEYTGYKTFEIVPEVPNPDNYEKMVALANQQRQNDARPAIKNPLNVDLSHYSTIFIGSGVWGGQPPMIMRTFYETYRNQLAGKRIIPFGTHEGSGISSLVSNIRTYLPESTVDTNSLGIYGHDIRSSQNEVNAWLASLGLTSGITMVNSKFPQIVNVYSISGQMLCHGVECDLALEGLAKGFYIVDGRKVLKQ